MQSPPLPPSTDVDPQADTEVDRQADALMDLVERPRTDEEMMNFAETLEEACSRFISVAARDDDASFHATHDVQGAFQRIKRIIGGRMPQGDMIHGDGTATAWSTIFYKYFSSATLAPEEIRFEGASMPLEHLKHVISTRSGEAGDLEVYDDRTNLRYAEGSSIAAGARVMVKRVPLRKV